MAVPRQCAQRCLAVLVPLLAACQGFRAESVDILVQPARLSFQTTLPSPAVEQTVEVTSTGMGGVLVISGIALVQMNDLTIPAEDLLTTDCAGNPRNTANPLLLVPHECARFTVRYTPTIAEAITNTVVITSNATWSPVVKVPITAVNEAPPEKCPAALLPVAQISAMAGGSQLPAGGTTLPGPVTLSGAGSTATAGATLVGYDWSFISGPTPGPTSLETPSLVVDATAVGSYNVGLIVADSNGCLSPPATFPFEVKIPPCYMVQPPSGSIQAFVGQTSVPSNGVLQDTTVSLHGTPRQGTRSIASTSWTLLSAPPGNSSSVEGSGDSATLDCTTPGTYEVGLTVTDAGGCAGLATLDIQVTALPPTCGPATQFIYAIDDAATLYAFSPGTVTMTPLGVIQCPDSSGVGPNTMAVDRQGIGWVEYTDGNVFRVNTTSLECFATAFDPTAFSQQQLGWGSCFAANPQAMNAPKYFVADGELAVMDTQTVSLTQIGPFTGLGNPNAANSAELTGTSDGRLFGFFLGTPWILAGIDETTGAILSQTPLPTINTDMPSISSWAFASWGEDFWFFTGDGTETGIYHFDATARTTTLVTTYPAEIVGAGVSPCVQL